MWTCSDEMVHFDPQPYSSARRCLGLDIKNKLLFDVQVIFCTRTGALYANNIHSKFSTQLKVEREPRQSLWYWLGWLKFANVTARMDG